MDRGRISSPGRRRRGEFHRAVMKDWVRYSDDERRLLLRFAEQSYESTRAATSERKDMDMQNSKKARVTRD